MSCTVATMAKDQKTRYQGVYVRHQRDCAANAGRRCGCRPGYMARVWDRAERRQIRSPTFKTAEAAKNWRTDTINKLDRGELPDVRSDVRLGSAVDRFVAAAGEGKVLTKHGRRYKATAIDDLECALKVHVVPELGGKRLADVRRGDVQKLVDELTPVLSGSRVRTVVNALRSLYRWAQDRDHVSHDPAALVRLPAMNAKPRDRVASPAELRQLLDLLKPDDALPYALAAYATARRQELRLAQWGDVDLEADVMLLGRDELARKSAAALRVVPVLRPLHARLKREWLAQGRPSGGKLICPPRWNGASGLLSMTGVARRARTAWGWEWQPGRRGAPGAWIPAGDDALQPIGLHECRHTAASWMNAAGVNPKLASILMGHSTPERAAAAAAGAASITLSRYTHVLPGHLELARDQLNAFIDPTEAPRTLWSTS